MTATQTNHPNLRRGSVKGKAQTAAATAANAENRRQERELQDLSQEDPEEALLTLHGHLTKIVLRLMRKIDRTAGGEPTRGQLDTVREFRQLSDRIVDIVKARGSTTETERFFAGMEARLAKANLAEGPRSIHAADGAGAG